MPTYEFRCADCNKRFEIFATYATYDPEKIRCPYCQSSHVKRKIGRIRVAKSEESRFESMLNPNQLAGVEDNPQALGKLMRQFGNEAGEDLPPEFSEVADRLSAGQSPEEIERQVPDLENLAGSMDDVD